MSDTKNAVDVFAATLDRMMEEEGLSLRSCTREKIRSIVKECFLQFDATWTEFLQYAIYGEDKKRRTMALVRSSLRSRHGQRG